MADLEISSNASSPKPIENIDGRVDPKDKAKEQFKRDKGKPDKRKKRDSHQMPEDRVDLSNEEEASTTGKTGNKPKPEQNKGSKIDITI